MSRHTGGGTIRSAVTMSRLKPAAVLVLAVLLAAQLTLHNHSLIPEAGGAPALPCSVCAFGADPATGVAPIVAAVVVVVFLLVAREQHAVASAARIVLPSRAPPRR